MDVPQPDWIESETVEISNISMQMIEETGHEKAEKDEEDPP